METSRYFERTLFHDLSPTAEEYYARSVGTVFEKATRCSKIEVRIQSSTDISFFDRNSVEKTSKITPAPQKSCYEKASEAKYLATSQPYSTKDSRSPLERKHQPTSFHGFDRNSGSESEDAYSMSSKASSTAPPAALDHHQGSNPPVYSAPKLITVDLDTERMRKFVKHTRHDFRVFFIRQRNSFSRLQITKDCFEQLLSSCHVFPRFKEYVIGLGSKSSDSEVTPPPLKFRPLVESRENSYHGFECSYLLRYVEHTNRPGGRSPYSVRQFSVYHRYKPRPVTGCSTWILVGSSGRAERRLDEFTRSIDDLMASNPFELHTIFFDTAIASWRPYLGDLETLVRHQSDKAVVMLVGGSGSEPDFVSLDVEDHQELKQIEDQIAELILYLDSTLDTVTTFQNMYNQFHENCSLPATAAHTFRTSAYESDAIMFALKEKAREIAHTRMIAESLLSKVQNTRSLISSLLEREGGHNINQQILALQSLEKQGQDENAIMRKIAEKNSRDSSSMRILTIITMIYLPCTIVSNFYSTQFVNQRELPSGEIKLEYSQNAYIFFAISVPLTLLTISVWYCWVNWERFAQLVTRHYQRRGIGHGERKEITEGRLPFAEPPRR